MARLAFLFLLLSTSLALAEPLKIERSQEKMKVDGALIEWRGATFRELGTADDGRVRFALASVDGGLYVGAEIYDDALVVGGDALVLTLAMPKDKGFDASEIWLYPGSGKVRAQAMIGLNGATPALATQVPIVEGPLARGTGYVVEAFVPWSALVGSAHWHDARGGLRFVDKDGGKEKTLRTDPAVKAADLPALSSGLGQEDMLGSFLADHQLVGVKPRLDSKDNVAGDARQERVVIIGQYVVVFGPGFKNGESYNYDVLPFAADGGMKSAQLIDLTGDGIKELVASGRQGNLLGLREVWVVLGLDELGMHQKFGIETKKESKGGFLENAVAIVPGRGKEPPRIEQKVGRAQGLDASTYREDAATDMQPVLLPWGEVSARTFAFDGKKFAQVDEKRRALPKTTPTTAAALPMEQQEQPANASHDALVAAFKQQQGIPAAVQASQTTRANIALGPEPELIEAYGKVLMLSGPEIGGGNGFMAYATPATDPRDLIEVRAGDVTNDQRAELLLRVRQQLSGAAGADRELLIVLSADAQGRFVRIGLFEVTRNLGERSVENQYSAKNGTLTIAPGGARVWTKDTYPFTDEASGGAGKLLLPWKDKSVRYRFTNGALQPE